VRSVSCCQGDNVKGYGSYRNRPPGISHARFFKTAIWPGSSNGYVTLVGRAKDLIITGGPQRLSKEVEAVIDEIDGVPNPHSSACHPDSEAVAAVVVRNPTEDITER